MKMDWFTKSALGIIALMLSVISLRPFYQTETVKAQRTATRQQWEYKIVFKTRSFSGTDNGASVFYDAADWGDWSEDGKALPKPVDTGKKLAQLGHEGWELITVEPLSSNATSGVGGGFSMGGVTTDEKWVFNSAKVVNSSA